MVYKLKMKTVERRGRRQRCHAVSNHKPARRTWNIGGSGGDKMTSQDNFRPEELGVGGIRWCFDRRGAKQKRDVCGDDN